MNTAIINLGGHILFIKKQYDEMSLITKQKELTAYEAGRTVTGLFLCKQTLINNIAAFENIVGVTKAFVSKSEGNIIVKKDFSLGEDVDSMCLQIQEVKQQLEEILK